MMLTSVSKSLTGSGVAQVAQNVAGMPSSGSVTPGCDLGELCFAYDPEQRVERTTYPNGDTLLFDWTGPRLDRVTALRRTELPGHADAPRGAPAGRPGPAPGDLA
jgi:hypothetical protein